MIPRPQHHTITLGSFDLTKLRFIAVEGGQAFRAGVAPVAALLCQEAAALGLTLDVVENDAAADGHVLRLDEDRAQTHVEGYRADVKADGVTLAASGARGIFQATRTLLVALGSQGSLPYGSLIDAPRYAWRGVHLDVARHYYPVEFIKRFIDLLALHKMNVFHWHLTEDQGWRIQIDAFPKLAELAAFRKHDDERYGGVYTKDEVREVVRYAAERFVEVVPEIEMPGHAVAALAAYPELSCTGGPFEVETRWGIFDDVYCVGNDQTLEFLERVVDEVIELFPSRYFHIGGDECPKKRWRACPNVRRASRRKDSRTKKSCSRGSSTR